MKNQAGKQQGRIALPVGAGERSEEAVERAVLLDEEDHVLDGRGRLERARVHASGGPIWAKSLLARLIFQTPE